MPRAKQPMTLMVRDAEKREQCLVDRLASDFDQRDKRMVAHLDDVVKGISESLGGRMTNLEATMQNQWAAFEKKWENPIPKRVRVPYPHECPN